MADAIEQLLDDVLVDAYGADEQLSAFRQAFEDTAVFPFAARVVGAEIEVSHVVYVDDDHRGLLVVCHRDGKRYTISLLDVVPDPATSQATQRLIDAYRRWAGADPLPSRPARQARPRAPVTQRRKTSATVALDALRGDEQRVVLAELLRLHPELVTEAEGLAKRTIASVAADEVADEVAWALEHIPLDDLSVRAGRHRGGYTEPHEAAWELVEQALDPFINDLRRAATVGEPRTAATIAAGILTGLRQVRDPAGDTVLAYAGPDPIEYLSDRVSKQADELGVQLPDDLPVR